MPEHEDASRGCHPIIVGGVVPPSICIEEVWSAPSLELVAGAAENSRKYANGTTTSAKLLEYAMKELDRSGPLDFNLDTVLAESGVSRGSFYHHFGDRASVIARCEAELLKQSLKTDNEALRFLVENLSNGQEIFDLLAIRIRQNGSEEQVRRRRQRFQSIAMAFGDDSLRELLNDQQTKGTNFFYETLQESERRGQIAPVIDLEGIAHFIQAIFLGHVLVDQMNDERLSALVDGTTVESLRLLLRPQP